MNTVIIISKCLVLPNKCVVCRKVNHFVIPDHDPGSPYHIKRRDPASPVGTFGKVRDDALFGQSDCTMLVNF